MLFDDLGPWPCRLVRRNYVGLVSCPWFVDPAICDFSQEGGHSEFGCASCNSFRLWLRLQYKYTSPKSGSQLSHTIVSAGAIGRKMHSQVRSELTCIRAGGLHTARGCRSPHESHRNDEGNRPAGAAAGLFCLVWSYAGTNTCLGIRNQRYQHWHGARSCPLSGGHHRGPARHGHADGVCESVAELQSFESRGAGLVQRLLPADQTIHWADPYRAVAACRCKTLSLPRRRTTTNEWFAPAQKRKSKWDTFNWPHSHWNIRSYQPRDLWGKVRWHPQWQRTPIPPGHVPSSIWDRSPQPCTCTVLKSPLPTMVIRNRGLRQTD
jgi:hypothetical protein